ncbi:MAG TPA: carbamoyltransferase C-terminal domain-containing protein [Elusimicrobiota bacterium]|nr:carbamoyltransferase C-terminal domain-containing protein [Elusimicrobiota bacterium]
MLILGVNAYHGDSSACILRDGQLIAAAEEERFRRIKHWAGFPALSIRYCLEAAGARLSDLDAVAINQNPLANLSRKILYAAQNNPTPGLILDRFRRRHTYGSIEDQIQQLDPRSALHAPLYKIEHHPAHLASAYYGSGFESAVVASVDGFGDFVSAAWGFGEHSHLTVQGKVYFPHSLGLFYQTLTQFLGFTQYGDEYKVMGLAPYGEPAFLKEMQQIVSLRPDGTYRLNVRHFRHPREKVLFKWNDCAPKVDLLFTPELNGLLGPHRQPADPLTQRHRDLARSVQVAYEEAFFHLLNALHWKNPSDQLALAGGCAMNSVANGKIYNRTPFRRLYVQAAADDAGGCLGAALSVWCSLSRNPSLSEMNHAYWGPEFSGSDIARLIGARQADLEAMRCRVDHFDDETALCDRVARGIAAGQVVGWFQGRMEWGPRALGNRSILCDPRRGDMKELLNAKIKRREEFRPFAPAILRECVSDYFEVDGDVYFMSQVFPIRPDKRAAIPAVTHVDGTGRLQTVHSTTNPRFYRLISRFRDLTGVPILLNTSFNENEPIVCVPAEALDCFLRTQMDTLVLGDYVISRAA